MWCVTRQEKRQKYQNRKFRSKLKNSTQWKSKKCNRINFCQKEKKEKLPNCCEKGGWCCPTMNVWWIMSLGRRRWNQRGKHLWKLATNRFLPFKRKKKERRWEVWRKKEVRDERGRRRGFTFQLFQTPPSYITMFKEGWFELLKTF